MRQHLLQVLPFFLKKIDLFVRFYNYFISPDKVFIRELTNILGFVPRKVFLYKKAFTHKSIAQSDEDSELPQNNERLEFLGDAVLDTVTAEYLFKKYPKQYEGFLTQMRSKLVNRKSLNKLASQMGLDVFMRQHGSSRISQTMMGNTFEALIGAIYLDIGYKGTHRFIVNRMLKQYVDVHQLENQNLNFKSQLLEYSQKNNKTIQYNMIHHYRTNSNRERFKIEVTIDGDPISNAEDFSKKSAEQKASEKALLKLGLIETASEKEHS